MNKNPGKRRKHSLIYSLAYDDSPLDERQKALSTKITVESLVILSSLIISNIFVMEHFYKWCETFSDSTFIICGVCIIYFVLRNGITGCLFGIKGVRRGMMFAPIMMFFIALLGIKNTFTLTRIDDKPFRNAYTRIQLFAVLGIVHNIYDFICDFRFSRKERQKAQSRKLG